MILRTFPTMACLPTGVYLHDAANRGGRVVTRDGECHAWRQVTGDARDRGRGSDTFLLAREGDRWQGVVMSVRYLAWNNESIP